MTARLKVCFSREETTGSDLSTGCEKFLVQTLRDTQSGSPQRVHFGANRWEKPASFGSHQQSEDTRDLPDAVPPCAPAIVQQKSVRAKLQGQMNRLHLATSQPCFPDVRNRVLRI